MLIELVFVGKVLIDADSPITAELARAAWLSAQGWQPLASAFHPGPASAQAQIAAMKNVVAVSDLVNGELEVVVLGGVLS